MRKLIFVLYLFVAFDEARSQEATSEKNQVVSFEDAVNRVRELSFDVQRAQVDVLLAKTDRLKTFAQIGPTWNLNYGDTTNARALTAPLGPNGEEVLVQPLQTKDTTISIGLNLTAIVAGLAQIFSQGTTISLEEKKKEIASIATGFAVGQIYRLAQRSELELEVAKARLKAAEKKQRDTIAFFRYGKISKAEKLQIDFNANNASIGLLNAQNEWLNAQATLKKMLHLNSEAPLQLDKMKDLKEETIPQIASESDALNRALSSRDDLLLANLTVQSLDTGRWLNLATYLPMVTVETNWRFSGALVSAFSQSNTQYLTFNATWNFWDNGAGLIDFRKTHLQSRSARIRARELTVDVKIDIEKAHRNFELARETLKARALGLEQAQEAYRGIEARFALGSISVTDFLLAEGIFNQAKLDHLAATVGIDIAYMNLQKAMGDKKPVPL